MLFKWWKPSLFLTTNCNWVNISDSIKLFDFNGKKIEEINNSNDCTVLIDTYYDNKSSKIYILTANNNNVKSYDYKKNKIYNTYEDIINDKCHRSIIIYENDNIIKLVESSQDGIIRIWNFHSGKLLKKIYVNNRDLIGIYLNLILKSFRKIFFQIYMEKLTFMNWAIFNNFIFTINLFRINIKNN